MVASLPSAARASGSTASLWMIYRKPKTSVAHRAMVHTNARSQNNPTYPTRFSVPDESVPWSVPFPTYAPTRYTFQRKDSGFADPDDPRAVADLKDRFSYEGALQIDPDSDAPLNPAGRTGMIGRGRLAKCGARITLRILWSLGTIRRAASCSSSWSNDRIRARGRCPAG